MNVIGFVEASAQFDDGGDLLAIVDRRHQRADDPWVPAGAIEGLFDGEDVGIGRGLFQKIHHALEILIRMVQQDVLFANGSKNVRLALEKARNGANEWLEAQTWGMVALTDNHQSCRIQGAIDQIQIIFGDSQRVQQGLGDWRRAMRVHFQADGVSLATVVQFGLDRFEQIRGLLLIDVELAVACDAKMPITKNLRGRKQVGQIKADKMAHHQIFLARFLLRHSHDARQDARYLHHGEIPDDAPAHRNFKLHDDVERLV